MGSLSVNLCGIELDNPVIPASGTFGYGYEFAELYDINCLGTFSFKGTTKEPRFGNPTPRIAECTGGMINAVGLQNPGVDKVISEELPKLKACFHKPVMANVSGFSVADYAYTCERLDKEEQVGWLEVNVSCPNVHGGGMSFGTDPKAAAAVTRAVKDAVKKPVIVKIAAVHNVAAIASGIARSGADIIAIDGFRGGTGAAPTRIRDNVGIPIELALAAVDQRLREEGIRNHVSLIAGGSIRSSADVVKAIALGADACYIGTAALLALGCHLCRSCQTGLCNWGITTQRPELVKRLDIDEGSRRLVNLMTAWRHEIKEMMGGMGINSVEALRGNRLMLRGIGLTDRELHILGISHAGE